MARKTVLDPTAGKTSIAKRIRDFIQGPSDEGLIHKVKDMGGFMPMYQNSIWQSGAALNPMRMASEIPSLLRDPIISAAINLLMGTCFSINQDQRVFWVRSKYPILVEELEKFHTETLLQKRILTLGYNVVVWGNVPIKLIYDKDNRLVQFKFIGDYNLVVPIIVSGQVVGYLVEGEYHYPLEYVFAQSQYNHDLGGPLGHGIVKFGTMAYGGSAGGNVMNRSGGGYSTQGLQAVGHYDIENEFTLAPSYIANAIRPWRNIKIIEDALLLARLDQSNYFRIFTVNVGSSVDSKPAIRILNYYRSLFKKVRRVSYDSSGMSSQGGGNEFEVILPKTNAQGGVEVTDVGGQCLRGSTRIRLSSGRTPTIAEMFADKLTYTNDCVYSVSLSMKSEMIPITDIICNRRNAQFVRVFIDTGEYFDCTPDHPCYTSDSKYIPAANLTTSSKLVKVGGNASSGITVTYARVTAVSKLTCTEDAYDIVLGVMPHNFALSCGIVVHNSDVKALKDLDVQYQRLFAALNLQPSQIGFGQGQSSNINMGASPEESWELRWMRTCKLTLFSVFEAIRSLDLYYLRSRGFRVDSRDWSYGSVLQNQLDDHERGELLSSSVGNLKTLVDTFTQMQLPNYNKKYLVRAMLNNTLSSIDIDVDTLLSGEGEAVPGVIQQDYRFRQEEFKRVMGDIEQAQVFPAELIESMRGYMDSNFKTESDVLLSQIEYVPNKLTLAQIQSGVTYLSYPSAEIDLDSFFKRVASLPENIVRYTGQDIVSSIDINSTFYILNDFAPVTVQDMTSAGVASIISAIMLSPKAFILTERDDVLTLMYLKVNQSFSAIVENLYYVKEA